MNPRFEITLNETGEHLNGKPVFTRVAKSVLNKSEGFGEKLLCDGLTLSLGDACAASCTYCYVPSMMNRLLSAALAKLQKLWTKVRVP
jgi:DNA repair photolyase